MAASGALDLARLAIVFDTSSAPGAVASMQQVVVQSRTVGQVTDQNTAKQRENAKASQEAVAAINRLTQAHAAAASGYKRGTQDGAQYVRTLNDIKRALDEEAKAAAAVASGHQQRAAAIARLMSASRDEYQRGGISAQQYAGRLSQLQVEMNKLTATQQAHASSAGEGAQSMALLSGAVGGFLGVFSFGALSGMTQFATFLTSMPADLAHAGDEFERLSARITFAFRGSAEAARLARADMIRLAEETGTPLSQVAQGYGDLAIAGRGPGLTRGQITGLTGSFSTLGAMTGADNASTGRAMWQFQQALALGRLTSQDYRFMATNMPAIDDALAAGLGVDVNTIPGRISRGEIDANKMVDAMIRGVEILRETSGGLPETMERARGRVQTQWELMLHNIEESIKSSEFYQGLMGGVADGLRDTRMFYSGASQDRIDWLRGFQTSNPTAFQRFGGEAELQRMEAEVNSPMQRAWRSRNADKEQGREARQVRDAIVGRGLQAADGMFSLDLQRADLNTSIGQITAALGEAGAVRLPTEDVEKLNRALAAARVQLASLVSAAERRTADAGFAAQDLTRYGAGAGFDMARSARSLMDQSTAQGRPIGMPGAMAILLRERLTGADNELGVRDYDISRREDILRPSFGGDAAARRRAALDMGDAEFRAGFGGTNVNNAEVAARTAQNRALREREFALEDGQSLADRERADRERIESMRMQLTLGSRLGLEARVALAQAERELEIRREFPNLTREQIEAERERVGAQVRITEELTQQREQMGMLSDAAETAGTAITRSLREGIIEGARTGTLRAETFFDSLGDSALRVADRIMAAFLRPIENQATSFIESFIGNIVPGIGGKPVPGFADGVRNFGGGWAIVGERGPELLNLPQGSNVFSNGESQGMMGARTAVTVIDQRSGGNSEPVQVHEKQGANGERQIEILVRDAIKKNIEGGAVDREVGGRYGLRPAVRRL